MFDEENDSQAISAGAVLIVPKKDFKIVCNDDEIILKEGEEIEVPEKYIENLKTEGVI